MARESNQDQVPWNETQKTTHECPQTECMRIMRRTYQGNAIHKHSQQISQGNTFFTIQNIRGAHNTSTDQVLKNKSIKTTEYLHAMAWQCYYYHFANLLVSTYRR